MPQANMQKKQRATINWDDTSNLSTKNYVQHFLYHIRHKVQKFTDEYNNLQQQADSNIDFSNPSHPKTQEYLKQLNELQREILMLTSIYMALDEQHFQKELQESAEKLESQEEQQQPIEYDIPQADSIPEGISASELEEQKKTLEAKIEELEQQRKILIDLYQASKNNVKEIDTKWRERQTKFKQDLIKKVEEKAMPVFFIDQDNKPIPVSTDQFQSALAKIPPSPDLSEKLNQPDIKQQLLDLIDLKREEFQDYDVINQMVKKENVVNQIKIMREIAELNGNEVTPKQLLHIVMANKGFGSLMNDLTKTVEKSDEADMLKMMKSLLEMSACHSNLEKNSGDLERTRIAIKEINNMISEKRHFSGFDK